MSEVWPPPYSLRTSNKAKRISLKVCPKNGLEIVIPAFRKRYNTKQILEEHKSWIIKHYNAIEKSKKPIELPEQINLLAIEQSFSVSYLPIYKNKIKPYIQELSNLLLIHYIENEQKNIVIKKLLEKWVSYKAKQFLIPWMRDLSIKHNLPVAKINVRKQKTIWGSCDQNHNISLNSKLLFLPKSLTNHVLLHELAHTKYFDHSKEFWQLLESLDLIFSENKFLLKKADDYIPRIINF